MASALGLRADVRAQDLEVEQSLSEPQAAGRPTGAVPQRRVVQGLELRGTFDEFQDFSNCVIEGPVSLEGARFRKGFSFQGCEFRERVRLKNISNDKVANSKASFRAARFHKSFKIEGGATVLTTLYKADFSGAIFYARAQFSNARFSALADFSDAAFNGPANFSMSVFNGIGSFLRTRFTGPLVFEGAAFRFDQSHARFSEARFHEQADFRKVQFSGDALFDDAHFTSSANFRRAIFAYRHKSPDDNEESNDSDSRSTESFGDRRVSFERAVFKASPGTAAAYFKRVRFGDARDPRAVSFRESLFTLPLLKVEKTFPGCSFRRVECHGPISFEHAKFDALDIDFSQSAFKRSVDLSGAHFTADAKFEKCSFKEDILVGETSFSVVPDFRQAILTHTPEFGLSNIVSLAPIPTSMLPKDVILQRLRAIRRLASRADDKRVENIMFIGELKLEGGTPSRLYRLVSNYGQSWVRPVFWLMLFTLILFPLAYLAVTERLPVSGQQMAALVEKRGLACTNGALGDAAFAALEISLRNALIVGYQDQNRASELANCLGRRVHDGDYRAVIAAVVQATQVILTLTLVFFVGAAVRKRLQIR